MNRISSSSSSSLSGSDPTSLAHASTLTCGTFSTILALFPVVVDDASGSTVARSRWRLVDCWATTGLSVWDGSTKGGGAGGGSRSTLIGRGGFNSFGDARRAVESTNGRVTGVEICSIERCGSGDGWNVGPEVYVDGPNGIVNGFGGGIWRDGL